MTVHTPAARTRATAKVSVERSHAELFDTAAGPELRVLELEETFTGDIEGRSIVRALQIAQADGAATMVSLQRVCGRLHGREGTFVLEGRQTISGGRITAAWSVAPGSGTGELQGLAGEGGFEGEFGQGSDAWLDYRFA